MTSALRLGFMMSLGCAESKGAYRDNGTASLWNAADALSRAELSYVRVIFNIIILLFYGQVNIFKKIYLIRLEKFKKMW